MCCVWEKRIGLIELISKVHVASPRIVTVGQKLVIQISSENGNCCYFVHLMLQLETVVIANARKL